MHNPIHVCTIVYSAVYIKEPMVGTQVEAEARHRPTPDIVEEMRQAAAQAGNDLEKARVNAHVIGNMRHLSLQLVRKIIACNFALPFAYMHKGRRGSGTRRPLT
jgi:hypothetical protein